MATTRDDFLQSVKTPLAGRAGWKCSFPNCNRSTAGPSSESSDKSINNGIAAHITAAAPGGPRYDPTLTPQQRSDISNAIWMCPTHGSLIDKDKTAYTTTEIRSWKEAAESRAQRKMEHAFNLNPSQLPQPPYSPKDVRILGEYGNILSYELIQLIKNEPFGNFIKHEVINPFFKIFDMEDNPKFQFQDDNLEKLRRELNTKAILISNDPQQGAN